MVVRVANMFENLWIVFRSTKSFNRFSVNFAEKTFQDKNSCELTDKASMTTSNLFRLELTFNTFLKFNGFVNFFSINFRMLRDL